MKQLSSKAYETKWSNKTIQPWLNNECSRNVFCLWNIAIFSWVLWSIAAIWLFRSIYANNRGGGEQRVEFVVETKQFFASSVYISQMSNWRITTLTDMFTATLSLRDGSLICKHRPCFFWTGTPMITLHTSYIRHVLLLHSYIQYNILSTLKFEKLFDVNVSFFLVKQWTRVLDEFSPMY